MLLPVHCSKYTYLQEVIEICTKYFDFVSWKLNNLWGDVSNLWKYIEEDDKSKCFFISRMKYLYTGNDQK